MKIDEILSNPLSFKVVERTKSFYSAEFQAGKREIRFFASNEAVNYGEEDEGEWIIEFGEVNSDGYVSHGKTRSGNEFEVFATLKSIIKDFIGKCNPKIISFSADKDKKNNRARVYAKLFQRNMLSGWKLKTDDDPNEHVTTFFTMVREGMMKRSDPYISGEKSGIRPPDEKLAPRPATAHRSKLETLMKKSGKSMEKVEAAWNKAAKETPDGPKKWANVMIRAKADLGISI